MKKLLLFVLATLMLSAMPCKGWADSYASLWKQSAKAAEKGHPRTQLKSLYAIIGKAKTERAYGHLLKAQLQAMSVLGEISPDSVLPSVHRLEREMQAAEGNNAALAAVYTSVLGKIYDCNPQLSDSSAVLAKNYFARSMRHPDLLAKTYTTVYEPFVADGIDSRIFGDDLLHVVGMESGAYRTLHDFYKAQGNRPAACYCALQMLADGHSGESVVYVKKSKYISSLDSLISEYADLNEAGEVAIERYSYMENAADVSAEEKMTYLNYALNRWGAWPRMNVLRNAQRRLTLPSFHVSLGESVLAAGQPRQVVAMAVCNVGELRMTVRRVNISGDTSLSPGDSRDYAKLKKLLTADAPYTQAHRYVGLPEYKVVRDTFEIPGLPVGVYLVEFSTDNTSVSVERELLRVSHLYPLCERLPGQRVRMAVVDAKDGLPVAGAKVRVTLGRDDKEVVNTYTCDSVGELTLDQKQALNARFHIYTDTDNAFPESSFTGYFSSPTPARNYDDVRLFTDRSIYRPGQTVHVSAWAFRSAADRTYKVKENEKLTLVLRDANHKEVARQELVTDAYGMASADFVLPTAGLTGQFTLRSATGRNGYATFSVEEYKRPTFQVEFDKVTAAYHDGDTVTVTGVAKSFAGVPVQGAQVVCRVARRPSLLSWWRGATEETRTLLSDTVRTDQQGTFSLRVPMQLPETANEHPNRFYSYDIVADVTDGAGETRHGETSLPLSDHPTLLVCDIPEKVERDSLKSVTFSYKNNAGENIDDNVTYLIDGVSHTCKANVPVALPSASMRSMRHSLVAFCGTDTLRTSFVTFTLDDRKAVIDTHDWFYVSSRRFPVDGKPVYVQLGSSDSVQHVVYTIVSGSRILENGSIDLTDGQLYTRALTYNASYGDGIFLTYAWVKDGKAYRYHTSISRPEPDRTLAVTWTTFRDRLVPGQKEEWRLSVTRPDGSAADAQLMATLYDKSLDDIMRHEWCFSIPSYSGLPFTQWNTFSTHTLSCYGEMPMRTLWERALDFSHYDGGWLLDMSRGNVLSAGFTDAYQSNDARVFKTRLASVGAENRVLLAAKAVGHSNEVADEELSGEAADVEPTAATSASGVQLRENFSETAAFFPGLVTDEKGNVSLRFTLPESITTWRLIGLAHDKNMNVGNIEGEAVARKTVMVQPNVPRFVRTNDRGQILARIQNTSDKEAKGNAVLSLLNAETGKEVLKKSVKYSIAAGENTTVAFDFDLSALSGDGQAAELLICRVTASGKGYSDGEQHYLPVLPDKERVTDTRPFTLDGQSSFSVDLSALFPVSDSANKVTVEYTNHPAWLMIQALPSLSVPDGNNAVSLATAYYANVLGACIMHRNPSIRQTVDLWRQESDGGPSLQSQLQRNAELKTVILNETPWVLEADREADQKNRLSQFFDEAALQYRISAALSKLQKLQKTDGSFSWWPGMEGNRYLTASVAELLVRLNSMAGTQKETASMLSSAFAFMGKETSREVKAMKAEAKKGGKSVWPSETAIHYLYLCSLDGRKLSTQYEEDKDYLVALLAKLNNEYTIYGKANTAVILEKNNHHKEAADLLQSIREYTVCTDEMGRYFDTPRARYSWCDYRIPTQVAAIEALKLLTPDDKTTVSQMQRWLLQSKRTQAWDTPVNSVNAVYAFIDGQAEPLPSDNTSSATVRINGQKVPLPAATAGLGYVKASKTDKDFRSLTVDKKSEGMAWGAVYAQYFQSSADVSAASSGLTVTRQILKGGVPVDGAAGVLCVGDRVTVRITVVADRDYDFVQVSDKRAACLEPATQLSGYGRGYYCAPKDNATDYFFDCLSKGKHVIETEYYVDRPGLYHTGTCTAQCAYSPEFTGRAPSLTLNISNK